MHVCIYVYMYICLFRRDKYVVQYEDWRTFHRLRAYNDVANNLMAKWNYSGIGFLKQANID